ncbi:hypothetical protein EXIGLDRAFT_424620 [Exidia glandulosa HHB12029]|uniref:Tail specific protease domain-containing protein n=1 Tax=Exidia glandulosa HHB12029 TaxID=1314781 RepID=A0A165KKM8_EXIGL|nr:hypothetical protein EXIGLDRAFT_424620 [Exidia glandulosa HHB12029]
MRVGVRSLVFSSVAAAATVPSPVQPDACKVIAAKVPFVPPEEALACLRSFPFNETIRKNVLANANGVLDFYTFEPYYLNSPPPFQESTVQIRADLKAMATKHYATDYDFSVDLYNITGRLNDGHTRWFPSCYTTFQNLLPAPITSLLKDGKEDVYIVPDLTDFIPLLGTAYTDFLANIGFNWQRLAGAKVLEIQGIPARDYVDKVAKEVSSNYLDHGVRVNSVYSTYRIVSNAFSQRFGDLAGPSLPTLRGLTFNLIVANGTKPEKVFVPYVSSYIGASFTDQASYWANNCAANEDTNGVDLTASATSRTAPRARPQPMGNIVDPTKKKAVGLPGPFIPTAPPVSAGSSLMFFVLPNTTTGVIFVGDFSPASFEGFQTQAVDGVNKLLAAGVTSLVVDVHNNGGGFICLGAFLYTLLAGTRSGYPGYQTTMRANPLAQKIVARVIEEDIEFLNYTPDGWAFFNDTIFPNNHNFITPPETIVVNGVKDDNSQRFHDTCVQFTYPPDLALPVDPPFPLKDVVVVGNGNCASTCALFTTLLHEKQNVRMAVFGSKPGGQVEYKGMAGNQVLEWADLDTEIKSVQLGNDTLAPPDLIVDGNFRVNWRTAWSFFDEKKPIAYVSEPAIRFAYTHETYNNPQNLWTFAAKEILKAI